MLWLRLAYLFPRDPGAANTMLRVLPGGLAQLLDTPAALDPPGVPWVLGPASAWSSKLSGHARGAGLGGPQTAGLPSASFPGRVSGAKTREPRPESVEGRWLRKNRQETHLRKDYHHLILIDTSLFLYPPPRAGLQLLSHS